MYSSLVGWIAWPRRYVDNAAMQLIRWPKQFDTILCGNIFGDILRFALVGLPSTLIALPSFFFGWNAATVSLTLTPPPPLDKFWCPLFSWKRRGLNACGFAWHAAVGISRHARCPWSL